MASISQAIHIFGQLPIDCHRDKGVLDLRRAVGRDAVEASRHGVPVAAKIGVHELGLVGQPPERVAEDRRPFAGLHDAKIDLLVVEAGVLLLMRRSSAHEDRAGDPPGRRVAVQVGRGLIDLVGRGRRAIDIAGDDRLPAHVEIVQQLRFDARRADRDAARHDHHRGIAIHPELVDGLRHQAQHAARPLEFFERSPSRIELVEQLGMDRVGLLQLASIILVRAALREVVGVLAVELRELLQRVVPVMELVAGDFLEQPPPDDLIALLLARRPP